MQSFKRKISCHLSIFIHSVIFLIALQIKRAIRASFSLTDVTHRTTFHSSFSTSAGVGAPRCTTTRNHIKNDIWSWLFCSHHWKKCVFNPFPSPLSWVLIVPKALLDCVICPVGVLGSSVRCR